MPAQRIVARIVDQDDFDPNGLGDGKFLKYVSASGKWVADSVSGGSAGGSNTQIQYNNAGAFGGSADLVWDGTNLVVKGITLPNSVGANQEIAFGGGIVIKRSTPIGAGPDLNVGGGSSCNRLVLDCSILRVVNPSGWELQSGFSVQASPFRVAGQGSTDNHYLQTNFNNIRYLEYNNKNVFLRSYNESGNKITFANNLGHGAGASSDLINIALRTSTTSDMPVAILDPLWVSNTHASRTGRMHFKAVDFNASRTLITIEADGSAGLLGFFGATAIAKPTVSGARNDPEAALASALAALANLGLITNSTTAS